MSGLSIGLGIGLKYNRPILGGIRMSQDLTNYPGLIAAWSAKGKTNDDEDRAILKDLTGNGHDITLNGFAFSEMSGYGGYNFTFKSLTEYTSSLTYIERNNTEDSGATRYLLSFSSNGRYKSNPSFKIKVIINSDYNINLKYIYYQDGIKKEYSINESGIYECPASEPDPNTTAYSPFISYSAKPAYIYVELLPEYPDALVFDGVDDYGSAVDFGGKEVKTVISKYQTLKESTAKFSMYFRDPVDGNIYKRIKTNKVQLSPSIKAFSNTAVILDDYCIIQQSPGNPTTKPFQITGHDGSFEVESIAFYSAYLFDRSLDEQEIKAFIRKYIDPEYLLPSEQTTE